MEGIGYKIVLGKKVGFGLSSYKEHDGRSGSSMTIRCEPRQARKGATAAVDSGM